MNTCIFYLIFTVTDSRMAVVQIIWTIIACLIYDVVAQERSICEQLLSGCTCSDGNKVVVCSKLRGPSSFPRPLPGEIVNLTITDSDLGDISPTVTNFAMLKSLQNIAITSSSIRYIQTCAVSNLQGLTSIVLDRLTINKIATNAFSHLDNIGAIEIKNTGIGEILMYAFHDIANLQTFRIRNVSVDKLDTTAFRDFTNVTTFDINDAKISEMENAPFQNFTNVDVIRLENSVVNSTVCGLDLITSERKSIGSVVLNGNSFVCNEGITRFLTAFSGQLRQSNNLCHAPENLSGKTLEEVRSIIANDADLPKCPAPRATRDDHSCRNYRIDQGILPPEEELPYDNDDGKNSAHFMSAVSTEEFSAKLNFR